jgi:hypothetical protein
MASPRNWENKMSMRKLGLALAAAAVTAFSMPANALVSSFTFSEAAGLGTGPWGTVTLTQDGANQVDVSVSLIAGARFVDTGGPHTSFVYNLNVGGVTISDLTSGFSAIPGPLSNTPFGSFSNGITSDCCGSQGNNSHSSPLNFSVNRAGGISIANFILSGSDGNGHPGGYLFSADILFNGFTGNVASGLPPITRSIPEPETYAMLLAGLGLMGFVARRRQRQLAA